MKNRFKDILKGKVVVVGIGNPMKGDDSFGPALIERLKDKTSMVCIDAGSTPESYAGKIIRERPDTILIVDAVHLGVSSGEYDILKSSEIERSGFTTHDISPRMFLEHLEKETGSDIYLLGVQPEDISFGAEMARDVKGALREIARLITEV